MRPQPPSKIPPELEEQAATVGLVLSRFKMPEEYRFFIKGIHNDELLHDGKSFSRAEVAGIIKQRAQQ